MSTGKPTNTSSPHIKLWHKGASSWSHLIRLLMGTKIHYKKGVLDLATQSTVPVPKDNIQGLLPNHDDNTKQSLLTSKNCGCTGGMSSVHSLADCLSPSHNTEQMASTISVPYLWHEKSSDHRLTMKEL